MYNSLPPRYRNPTPGVIINRPGGPDVYKGVPKDYTGDDVTPENFLKVLSGDVEGMKGVGSGKVVRSGPNDRIFLNMVDHGAPGIFAFPYDYLNATNLTDTIIGMHRDQKFGEVGLVRHAALVSFSLSLPLTAPSPLPFILSLSLSLPEKGNKILTFRVKLVSLSDGKTNHSFRFTI